MPTKKNGTPIFSINKDTAGLNRNNKGTYLLGISAISNRFIFIVFQNDMPKVVVWQIFDNVPFNREASTPFILLPKIHILAKVYGANHLCYTTELTTCIDLYKKIKSTTQKENIYFISRNLKIKKELTEKKRNTGQLLDFAKAIL